jgi:hypothetical protein
MSKQQQVDDFIRHRTAQDRRFANHLPLDPLHWLWGAQPVPWPLLPDLQTLTKEYYEDASFQALKLANVFAGPDAFVIAAVARAVFPPPLDTEFELVRDAMVAATKRQQQDDRKEAAPLAIFGTAGLILMCVQLFRGRGS